MDGGCISERTMAREEGIQEEELLRFDIGKTDS